MILDNNRNRLYICNTNKYVKLNNMETELIYFMIQKIEQKVCLYDIIKYIYKTKINLNEYVYAARNIIYRVNLKLRPFNIRIAVKPKIGYYIKQETPKEYFSWKKQFFIAHPEEKELLELYDKREKVVTYLEELEKNIETLEKNVI